jgi:DivIVA domain-containing protein
MRKKKSQPEIAPPHLEPKRITPVEIQQKEFRLAMRGYNERDVDQFLDEVTEEVARLYADNKRLREEVDFGRTTRLETGGAAEAEGIVRQAREEAARIIAEATARASTLGPAGGASPPGGTPAAGTGAPPSEIMSIFLARERAFLQNMANLIQAHAEGVKQDVRRVREQVPPPSPAPETPPAESPEVRAAPGAGEESATQRGHEARSAGMEMGTQDEPTAAWPAPPKESPEALELDPSNHDIVDLTREREGAGEEAKDESGRASALPPESGAALSTAYGRAAAPAETNELSRRGGESRAGASQSPRVEDEDAREDRSIRELFWGED